MILRHVALSAGDQLTISLNQLFDAHLLRRVCDRESDVVDSLEHGDETDAGLREDVRAPAGMRIVVLPPEVRTRSVSGTISDPLPWMATWAAPMSRKPTLAARAPIALVPSQFPSASNRDGPY